MLRRENVLFSFHIRGPIFSSFVVLVYCFGVEGGGEGVAGCIHGSQSVFFYDWSNELVCGDTIEGYTH